MAPRTTTVAAKRQARLSERSSAVAAILSSAEHVFATHGYEGTTMWMIAQESGISQALIHYHFKSKDNLYEEIFLRRSSLINPYRERLLEEALSSADGVSLERVLEIFFLPAAATLG